MGHNFWLHVKIKYKLSYQNCSKKLDLCYFNKQVLEKLTTFNTRFPQFKFIIGKYIQFVIGTYQNAQEKLLIKLKIKPFKR